jgi:hypothetical protein
MVRSNYGGNIIEREKERARQRERKREQDREREISFAKEISCI